MWNAQWRHCKMSVDTQKLCKSSMHWSVVWVLGCAIVFGLLCKKPVGTDRRVPQQTTRSRREKNDLTSEHCTKENFSVRGARERKRRNKLICESRKDRNGSKRHWMRNSRLAVLIATIPICNSRTSRERKQCPSSLLCARAFSSI